MTDTDLADWLTKPQAAEALRVSTKAIERWAAAKKLEQRSRPQAVGPNVAVYHPGDVARLASERHVAAPAFVLPAVPGGGNGHGRGEQEKVAREQETLLARVPADDDPIRRLFAAALRAVMSQTSQTPPVSQTPTVYVTLAEASAIAGLPQADLRRLIDDGDLACRRTGRGGIRIRRRDLEAL